MNYQQSNSNYQNAQTNSNQYYQVNDEELIDAYIGPNLDKIKNTNFSWYVFLFGPWYLLYRKMWLIGFGWLVGVIILGSFLPSLSTISLIASIILAVQFKKIYLNDVKEKVQKIKIENQNVTREQLIILCRKKGGTSSIVKIILGIICGLVIIMMLLLIITPILLSMIRDNGKIQESTNMKEVLYELNPSEIITEDYYL